MKGRPSRKWQDTETGSLIGIFIAHPNTIHPPPLPWVNLGSSISFMQRCPDSSCMVPEGVISQDQPFLSLHSPGYFVMATRNDRHTGQAGIVWSVQLISAGSGVYVPFGLFEHLTLPWLRQVKSGPDCLVRTLSSA